MEEVSAVLAAVVALAVEEPVVVGNLNYNRIFITEFILNSKETRGVLFSV
ncbi:hypothetical protein RAYM_02237 [Riemerella anatipestifer RA-YM]|nr:hypothetical protein RAYM_02237 [Riemerella anatipestifer RA-YM]